MLYLRYLSIHLKSQMQYKVSFVLMLLGQFVLSGTVLLSVWFLFMRFPQVQGFRFEEVLLAFAPTLLSFSLAELLGRGFDMFPQMLANGEFDRALVRPRGAVFQVLAGKVEFTRLGRLLQAVPVLAYAMYASGIQWTGDKVLVLLMMIACGTLVFFCLFVILAAISFFTLEGLELMSIFTHGGREFGRFPFSIYGKDVLRFLTFVVPLALVQYWPLLYLLGRSQRLLHALAPLFSLWFLLPAWWLWRLGLKHYKSTGS